jgi:signal transduction histidine kinase
VENGVSKKTRRPLRWLMRKLAQGLPPLPTIGGRALATRVAGLLLVGGAILIGVTVALPPAAEGSDLLILGYGAIAAVCGALMLARRRVSEPALGGAAGLGTLLITLATLQGGHGTGTEDNEVLFLWVSLFSFWFLGLRHALLQLGLIGVADAVLLIDQHPSFSDGVTRWLILVATLLVTGLLMAWIRRSLEREREETARLAVVAERMRIARDLHDAAGHGVTAISLQAAAGVSALEEGDDDEARLVLEEIRRTSRSTMEDMRKLLGLLRPGDAPYPERDRVSLSHLDAMIAECRSAGLRIHMKKTGDPAILPPVLDQTAYRIIQEALTNVLKHAGSGAEAAVRLNVDPASVELEVTDDGPGKIGAVAVGSRRGLIGMRERVELFGGRFDAGPVAGGGFRVFARLPLRNTLENFSRAR